jgi:putative peptide zinc metalloprotease protein
MNITMTSYIKLVPIEVRKDQKNFIVEDLGSGEFFEMPEICIDAIKMLGNGESLGSTEKKLKERYTEEEVDILDFASQLVELRLVEELDGVKIEQTVHIRKEKWSFEWISPKAGRFFFNKLSMIIYTLLFIANTILIFLHPELFPQYKDLFIFPMMALNIPTWIIISIFLLLIHEFGHILAVKASGQQTKLGVGHRLFLIVFETDMSSIWKLPVKDRNRLYLAGICFDTVILFLTLSAQLLFPNMVGILQSILHVMVLDIFIRMVYQCCVYMKTDLYLVIENSSGCYNLMENAQQLIRKRLPFIKESKTQEVIFEGERKTVGLYSIFYFIGVFLTIFLYVVFYIPQLGYAIRQTLPGLGYPPTNLNFWDSVLFLLQLLITFSILLFSWRKKYIKQ